MVFGSFLHLIVDLGAETLLVSTAIFSDISLPCMISRFAKEIIRDLPIGGKSYQVAISSKKSKAAQHRPLSLPSHHVPPCS